MGFLRGAATPSPPARGLAERRELPSGVRGGAPPARRFFHYFQHSGWPLLTLYNIVLFVDYHAAIGGRPRAPLAKAPAMVKVVL